MVDEWENLTQERKNRFLRKKNDAELVEKFGNDEDFYKKCRENNWDALTTSEKYTLLEAMDIEKLSEQYGKDKEFFEKELNYSKLHKSKEDEEPKKYNIPKKRFIESNKRDITFEEALCELIDNSIDGRLLHPSEEELKVRIHFDTEQNKGYYYDNSGGLSKENLHKIFIPAETIENEDYSRKTIGSFAMGAKKALFYLSDGITVYSALNNEETHYAEVPEGWINEKEWFINEGKTNTEFKIEGEERSLNGETYIVFERLINCPIENFDNIQDHLGKIYCELLKGKREELNLSIKINGIEIEPIDPIQWTSPRGGGAEPKRYKFSKSFPDLGEDFEDVEVEFELVFGLKPGQSKEMGFGIDIYGNYRLFDTELDTEVGLDSRKSNIPGARKSAKNLLRGKLFIHSHSKGIPWDHNKRKFIKSHPVGEYLQDCFEDIYGKYLKIANTIGNDKTSGTRRYLIGEELDMDLTEFQIENLGKINETYPIWDDHLPKWNVSEGNELCDYCDEEYQKDELKEVNDDDTTKKRPNLCCEDCYEEEGFDKEECIYCNEEYPEEDLKTDPNGDYCCEDCYEEEGFDKEECIYCHEEYPEEELTNDPNGDYCCEDCYEEEGFDKEECIYCHEEYPLNDLKTDPNEDYCCEDCYEEEGFDKEECIYCHEEYPEEDLKADPEGNYCCEGCYEDEGFSETTEILIEKSEFTEKQIELLEDRTEDELPFDESIQTIINDCLDETTIIIKLDSNDYQKLLEKIGARGNKELKEKIKTEIISNLSL